MSDRCANGKLQYSHAYGRSFDFVDGIREADDGNEEECAALEVLDDEDGVDGSFRR